MSFNQLEDRRFCISNGSGPLSQPPVGDGDNEINAAAKLRPMMAQLHSRKSSKCQQMSGGEGAVG